MPQQYDPVPLDERTYRIVGTAEALTPIVQPITLAQLATLRVGETVELGAARAERMT